MTDWSIAIMGPVGSGKTTAIRTASDIAEPLDTEVAFDEPGRADKPTTTVAMDMGALELDDGSRLLLLGAPGQDRFSHMWDILLAQARAAIVLVDGTVADAANQLEYYVDQVRQRTVGRSRPVPVVIGVTRADKRQGQGLEDFRLRARPGRCSCSACQPPVVAVDAHDRHSMSRLLTTATALLEIDERFPEQSLHDWLGTKT